jgi:small subunit ribosomal protein S4
MGRLLGPKCRLCRREGIKLFLKGARCETGKCAITRRNYVPGMHGPRLGKPRLTDYGRQLREKQKAKRLYNLLETQFHNYFVAAKKMTGDTAQNVYKKLEFRLDNAIYKSGIAESMRTSRQLVNHGHFLVNGKKVDIPSYQVKVGDVITLSARSLKSKRFAELVERMKHIKTADWLFYDSKDMTVKVTDVPDMKKVSLAFDMKSIIEFYSR